MKNLLIVTITKLFCMIAILLLVCVLALSFIVLSCVVIVCGCALFIVMPFCRVTVDMNDKYFTIKPYWRS